MQGQPYRLSCLRLEETINKSSEGTSLPINHEEAELVISKPCSLGSENAVANTDAMPMPYKNVTPHSSMRLRSKEKKEKEPSTSMIPTGRQRRRSRRRSVRLGKYIVSSTARRRPAVIASQNYDQALQTKNCSHQNTNPSVQLRRVTLLPTPP